MDEQESTSYGWVFAAIAGGVVLLLLVLFLGCGGFMFWRAMDVAVGPGAMAPVAMPPVAMEAKMAEPDPAPSQPPMQAVVPGPEQDDVIDKARKRLIGVWEAEGGTAVMEFRADSSLVFTDAKAKGSNLRWELIAVGDNRLTINQVTGTGVATPHVIEFRDNNMFLFDGNEKATYRRKAAK